MMRRWLSAGAMVALMASGSVAQPVTGKAGGQVKAAVPLEQGYIERSRFEAVIQAGPQRLIAAVQVKPHMKDGAFVGHELIRFVPGGALAGCRALRPGDVLKRVNGESLGRPGQFMHAWSALKQAETVEVELLRGGQPLTLRWRIDP